MIALTTPSAVGNPQRYRAWPALQSAAACWLFMRIAFSPATAGASVA